MTHYIAIDGTICNSLEEAQSINRNYIKDQSWQYTEHYSKE